MAVPFKMTDQLSIPFLLLPLMNCWLRLNWSRRALLRKWWRPSEQAWIPAATTPLSASGMWPAPFFSQEPSSQLSVSPNPSRFYYYIIIIFIVILCVQVLETHPLRQKGGGCSASSMHWWESPCLESCWQEWETTWVLGWGNWWPKLKCSSWSESTENICFQTFSKSSYVHLFVPCFPDRNGEWARPSCGWSRPSCPSCWAAYSS